MYLAINVYKQKTIPSKGRLNVNNNKLQHFYPHIKQKKKTNC